MAAPSWLAAQPIAHRGLHRPDGPIENSRAAARAAIARGFAIECDIERSADGEAFVFHDSTLERLTSASGFVSEFGAARLAAITLANGETIPTLGELLALIGGAVPLICEIKSRFDGDRTLTERAVALAADYAGALAFKSFDPEVIAYLRRSGVGRPLGVVAEASYDNRYFDAMSPEQKRDATAFLHIGRTRPDFLSWSVADLPHATPTLMRALGGAPVLAWTVRTPEDKRVARAYADQIVFEGEPD